MTKSQQAANQTRTTEYLQMTIKTSKKILGSTIKTRQVRWILPKWICLSWPSNNPSSLITSPKQQKSKEIKYTKKSNDQDSRNSWLIWESRLSIWQAMMNLMVNNLMVKNLKQLQSQARDRTRIPQMSLLVHFSLVKLPKKRHSRERRQLPSIKIHLQAYYHTKKKFSKFLLLSTISSI